MSAIKQRIDTLDERITSEEQRVSETEDRSTQQERTLAYLLRKEASITADIHHLDNASIRAFLVDFLLSSLKLPDDLDINMVRAHRSAATMQRGVNAPPRLVIICFTDYRVKQTILQQAWEQLTIQFQGQNVYFDHNYSVEVKRKRKMIRGDQNVEEERHQGTLPLPSPALTFLDSGTRIFALSGRPSQL